MINFRLKFNFTHFSAYCQALGSRDTDRCQPRPLQDGTFSTNTARLLRDAYQPLHSWLMALQLPKQGQGKYKESLLNYFLDLKIDVHSCRFMQMDASGLQM